MAQYLLGVQEPVTDQMPPAEFLEPIMAEVEKIRIEMVEAGVWVFSGGLHQPSASTVLRAENGEVLVTDGPYAEGKEHLGGFTIVDVPDLDAALDWGGRLARAIGLPIEVRPFRSAED
jgi:hypothetical protein